MKNQIKPILLSTILLGGGFWIGSIIQSSADELGGSTPGSVNDPIVTKSYVDQQIRSMVQEELSKQTVDNEQFTQLLGSELQKLRDELKSTPSDVVPLQIVVMLPGQTLYAGEGTEVIVRNGRTLAVSTDGNGIPDLTAGQDIPNGEPVPTNHLLLFPREGRGVTTAPDNINPELFLMVRGTYLLVDADGKPVPSQQ